MLNKTKLMDCYERAFSECNWKIFWSNVETGEATLEDMAVTFWACPVRNIKRKGVYNAW